jgi:hypothetical protein
MASYSAAGSLVSVKGPGAAFSFAGSKRGAHELNADHIRGKAPAVRTGNFDFPKRLKNSSVVLAAQVSGIHAAGDHRMKAMAWEGVCVAVRLDVLA